TIAVLDADTGQLVAAKRIPGPWEQVQLVQVDNVDETSVWVFPSGWQPGSDPLASRLDGKTLECMAGAKVALSDMRHERPCAEIRADRYGTTGPRASRRDAQSFGGARDNPACCRNGRAQPGFDPVTDLRNAAISQRT